MALGVLREWTTHGPRLVIETMRVGGGAYVVHVKERKRFERAEWVGWLGSLGA